MTPPLLPTQPLRPQASTVERDYLKHGFVAGAKEQEIPCSDYEVCATVVVIMVTMDDTCSGGFDCCSMNTVPHQVWITRSCVDVTSQLSDALAQSDPLSRANLLHVRRQDIARQAEEAASSTDGGCRCEVQEMWADKSYVRSKLFISCIK